MSNKDVWRHSVERDAWIENWCDRCFQPDQADKRIRGQGEGCPILAHALTGRLPMQWKLRRNAAIGDTYSCSEHLKQPPTNRRGSAPADTLPMFDEPTRSYIALKPVAGWPDYRGQSHKNEVDHQ